MSCGVEDEAPDVEGVLEIIRLSVIAGLIGDDVGIGLRFIVETAQKDAAVVSEPGVYGGASGIGDLISGDRIIGQAGIDASHSTLISLVAVVVARQVSNRLKNFLRAFGNGDAFAVYGNDGRLAFQNFIACWAFVVYVKFTEVFVLL